MTSLMWFIVYIEAFFFTGAVISGCLVKESAADILRVWSGVLALVGVGCTIAIILDGNGFQTVTFGVINAILMLFVLLGFMAYVSSLRDHQRHPGLTR